ncbi:hypothetical protein GN958_ATG10435, partial [Phytophthora infestans]
RDHFTLMKDVPKNKAKYSYYTCKHCTLAYNKDPDLGPPDLRLGRSYSYVGHLCKCEAYRAVMENCRGQSSDGAQRLETSVSEGKIPPKILKLHKQETDRLVVEFQRSCTKALLEYLCPGITNYCPSSVRYLLMYEDGSSDGVPVDEIEDHVSLLLQLPNKQRRLVSADRQAAARREDKAATFDKKAVVSRFIRTTLCELTEVLDVSDKKRQTLMTDLGSGKEQPHAALTQYDQEGGPTYQEGGRLADALPGVILW